MNNIGVEVKKHLPIGYNGDEREANKMANDAWKKHIEPQLIAHRDIDNARQLEADRLASEAAAASGVWSLCLRLALVCTLNLAPATVASLYTFPLKEIQFIVHSASPAL